MLYPLRILPINFFDAAGVLDVRLESASIAAVLSADASSSAEFVITAPRDMEADVPFVSLAVRK